MVGLSGVADNCVLGGANPRPVGVTNRGTASVEFRVVCISIGFGTLLFSSDRSGTSQLYRMEQDGSELVSLTTGESFDGDWSPDGSRIVFTAIRDQAEGIFVMEADGSNPAWLGVAGARPRWSPDGRRILFASAGTFNTDGTIRVMNADGTGVTTLASGGSPDWSPGGSSIAFQRIGQCVADLPCSVEIYLMAADGTQVRRLVGSSGPSDALTGPAWSPDGSRIAYLRRCCFLGTNRSGIWVVEPGGGGPTRIESHPAAGRPVWSPDGSAIAFAATEVDGTTELTVIPSGGGAGAVLAASGGSEYPTSWK
jgi:Tol biopolymer transport system component